MAHSIAGRVRGTDAVNLKGYRRRSRLRDHTLCANRNMLQCAVAPDLIGV